MEYCPLCPPGSLCPGNSSFPAECPIRSFCPEGSGTPSLCPNGTYGATVNLTSPNQCTPCPPGYFCIDGSITGECSSAYFCRSGQDTPTPYHDVSSFSDDPAQQLQFLVEQNGGQCPPGHFCYAGTYDPFPCENSTVRLETHGSSPDDCGPCPAGYTCFDGDPIPDPCEPGYYCPTGQTRIPCPLGRYNSRYSMSKLDDCLLCPAGSFCNATAVSNPFEWPCPTGEYCLNGTVNPLPCPSGSYRDELNADGRDACYECPAGYYCPRETDVYYSCPERSYCPPGSSNSTACPTGYYCPVNTALPIVCPENYYCPISTAVPQPCYRGTFCPNGTSYPHLCSLGYKAVDESNFTLAILNEEEKACEACPPGEYGDADDRLSCFTCTPGYVCLGATTTSTPTVDEHRGYICPKGAYCPAGSDKEIPCPVGTFQPNFGETNFSACINCEAGTYQSEEGQDSCFQCSASSSSDDGAATCECLGKNRNFQAEDGWCVCLPGYEFVDSDLTVSSEEDGTVDCQPIVYDRCLDTQSRSVSGACVDSISFCKNVCGDDVGGDFIDDVGTCECNSMQSLDEICGTECSETQKTVTCENGQIVVFDPLTDSSDVFDIDDIETQGSLDCSVENSAVYSVSAENGKNFEGQFGSGSVLDDVAATRMFRRHMSANVSGSQISSRNLQTSNLTTISNPLMCINQGDSIIFDVNNENYPIYDKDLLINSNLNYDYGAFRKLDMDAKSSLVLSSFSATFHTAGVYGFGMSSQPNQLLVVSVMPANVNCSTNSPFVPFSRSNLITMGISSDRDIVLSPDWNLIFGLLFGMIMIVLLLIGFIFIFRKRSWTTHYGIDKRARVSNKSGGMMSSTKGGFVTKVQPSSGRVDSRRIGPSHNTGPDQLARESSFLYSDVESAALALESAAIEFDDDMMVPELASHMQKNHDTIDRQMHIQKDLLSEIKEGLRNDLDGLKSMLETASLGLVESSSKSAKLAMICSKLKSSMTSRGVYETAFQSDQLFLMKKLSHLEQLLGDKHIKLSDKITLQIAEQAESFYNQGETVPFAAISSSVLDELITLLNNVQGIINKSIEPAVCEEERRYKNDEKSFQQMMKLNAIALPSSVLNHILICTRTDVKTDESITTILRKWKALALKIPAFITDLKESHDKLSKVLINSYETGNPSIAEREKHAQSDILMSVFLSLLEMILPHHNYSDLAETVVDCCRTACEHRKEFEIILDNLLQKKTDHARKFSQGSKKKRKSIDDAGDSCSSSSSDSDSTEPVVDDSDKQVPRQRRNSQIYVTAEEKVKGNNNLSLSQRKELLETVEQDVDIVDNIISVEMQHKDDNIENMSALSPPQSGDEIEMGHRHQVEKEKLACKLRSEHNRRLHAIMNREAVAMPSDDAESVNQSMVLTFAGSKYAILLRRHGVWCRIRFSALHEEYELKRADLFHRLMQNVPLHGRNVTWLESAKELERNIEKVNVEERNALLILQEELRLTRAKIEDEQTSIRENWAADWENVVIAEEITRLKQETESDFDEMKNFLNKTCSQAKEYSSAIVSSNKAMIEDRASVLDDGYRHTIMTCIEKDTKLSSQAVQERNNAQFHMLTLVEKQVNQILQLSGAWGPLINYQLLQDKLHERIIASFHSYHDGILRIAEYENNLKVEAAEMALFSKISKMNLDENAVSKAIVDFRTIEKEKADSLFSSIRHKHQDAVVRERQRQDQCVLDYEHELACATEVNAFRHALLCLNTDESRLKSLRVIRDAMCSKKDYLMSECAKKKCPKYVELFLSQQIDFEIQREECELNATYGFIACDILNTQLHTSHISEGLVPDTELASVNLACTYNKAVCLFRESMGAEIARVSCKSQTIGDNFRNFEGERHIYMEAPIDELKLAEDDISSLTSNTMQEVKLFCEKELHSIEGSMMVMLKSKQKNQEVMQLNIKNKLFEQESLQADLELTYKEDRMAILNRMGERGESSSNLVASSLLSFDQKAAATFAHSTSEFSDHMYNELQVYLRQQAGIERKEDVLNLKRNEKQQELESLEMTLSEERQRKLSSLLNIQRNRREDWMEDVWKSERNVHGLEVYFRARKDAAQDMLKKVFDIRRSAREKAWLDKGMSSYDASVRAENECKDIEEYEVSKLDVHLNKEESKFRNSIRCAMEIETKLTNRRFELLRDCVQSGFNKFELCERAELTNDAEGDIKDYAQGMHLEDATEDEKEKMLQYVYRKHAENVKTLLSSQKGIINLVFTALEKDAAEEKARVMRRDDKDIDSVEIINQTLQSCQDAFIKGMDCFEVEAYETLSTQVDDMVRARQVILVADDGLPQVDALAVAEEEMAPERRKMENALSNRLKRVTSRLACAISNVSESLLMEIGHNYEKVINGLDIAFKVKRSVYKISLKKRLLNLKERRHRELLDEGYDTVQAENFLTKEFSESDKLEDKLESDLSREQEYAMKFLEGNTSNDPTARMQYHNGDVESSESSSLRASLIRDELLYARTGFQGFYDSMSTALSAENGDFEAEIAALRDRYEGEILKLQQQMQLSKKSTELRGGNSKADKDKVDEKLQAVRRQHDSAVLKLKDDIHFHHQQSLLHMKERLAKKKATKLVAANLSDEEKEQVQASIEQEELKLTAELNKKYELTRDKQVEVLLSQQALVNEKLERAVKSGDISELYEVEISMKRGELAAAISKAIEAERSRLQQKSIQANLLKENAAIKLEGIRKQHDSAIVKLKDEILHQHKQSLARMKEKLAKKKANQLGVSTLSIEEKDQILVSIEQEERKQTAELNKKYEIDKEKQLVGLLSQQAQIQQKLKNIILQNEALQLEAVEQEAALNANQAIKMRIDEEAKRWELLRIQQEHREAEANEKEMQDFRRAKGEENLKNRLAKKREKREKELKKEEEDALAALERQQKGEKEEHDRLYEARVTWVERITEATTAASNMGLDNRGREDFCFSEVFGKNLVPETQLSEAATMIMKARHSSEMKKLLDAHFESRIAAIKQAVEGVLREKASARIALVNALNSKNSTDDFISLSLSDLDETFNKKQVEAEEAAVILLDRENMAAQVALRQQQLEEISTAISLYSDAESIVKLHSMSSKSRVEEIAEYRAALEKERREREDRIHREREEREQAIRAEHNKALEKMKADLELKKKQDEKDLELTRQQLEDDHVEKTQLINEKRKTMIKTKFEQAEIEKKEALERLRLTQKSKMLARRNAQRNRRAGVLDVSGKQLAELSSNVEAKNESNASLSSAVEKGTPTVVTSMQNIEQKLNHIERVISALDAVNKNVQHARPTNLIYEDRGNPPQGDELVKMADDNLSVQENARIQFGRRLAEMVGVQHLEIAAALSLPPSLLSNNSFKNSYHYDVPSNTLFIHNARLSSSGDFGLVVIHALSHIKVNPADLSNDSDPNFMSEFYTNLRILSQDLYKHSQSKKSETRAHSNFNLSLLRIGESADSEQRQVDDIHDRIRLYAKEGCIPREYFDRYVKEKGDSS